MSPRAEKVTVVAILLVMVAAPLFGGAYALRKRRTPRFDVRDEEREMARFSGTRRRRRYALRA